MFNYNDAATKLSATTKVALLPGNVKHVQLALTETMFNKLTGNQKVSGWLKYWDFLTAVGAAPGFCGLSRGMGKMA